MQSIWNQYASCSNRISDGQYWTGSDRIAYVKRLGSDEKFEFMKMQMIAADMMRRGGYQACVLYYVRFTLFMPAGGKPRQRFNRFWKLTYFIRSMHILRYVTGLGGWGMLTFMLTCVTCTSCVTSLGWGEVGHVNVHVNLRHMHILRYVTGLGGWGMLTFMLTCVTCTSYVTSLGWGGGGC